MLARLLNLFRRTRLRNAPRTGVTRRAFGLGLPLLGGAMWGAGPVQAAAPSGFAAMPKAALDTLLRGLAEVENVGDAGLSARATELLGQISEVMPEAPYLFDLHGIFRSDPDSWGAHRRDVEIDLEVIQTACHDARPLQIGYTDLQGQRTQRVIWPLALVYPDHGIFVLAWCCKRGAYRQFFAHAIRDLAVVEGSFADQRLPLLEGLVAAHST